jgi:hypothetical protein
MITTGQFARATALLADQVAKTTHLQVLLLDGKVLENYERNGASAIIAALREQAGHVLALKRAQDTLTATESVRATAGPD